MSKLIPNSKRFTIIFIASFLLSNYGASLRPDYQSFMSNLTVVAVIGRIFSVLMLSYLIDLIFQVVDKKKNKETEVKSKDSKKK